MDQKNLKINLKKNDFLKTKQNKKQKKLKNQIKIMLLKKEILCFLFQKNSILASLI